MTNAIQVVIGVVGGILVGMLGILYRRGSPLLVFVARSKILATFSLR